MGSSDVKVLTISDVNAADADRLVTAARPDTSATMANTTHANGTARNVTVTTAGTGDNAKTCTITGTDVFGDAMTEVITSTSSAETVAGAKYFLTVSAVECSAQYAANITVGSGSLCAQAVEGSNRVRLKGMSVVSGGTARTVSFYNGAPEDGTALFTARTVGTANQTVDRTIPENGVLFDSGLTVEYTLDVTDMLTIFYA
jgi:hypothetical protein